MHVLWIGYGVAGLVARPFEWLWAVARGARLVISLLWIVPEYLWLALCEAILQNRAEKLSRSRRLARF